jgi:dienelactone hydrolase
MHFTRTIALVCAALYAALFLPATPGSKAGTPPPLPVAGASIGVAASPERGGVAYDPAVPLDAAVTPRFTETDPPTLAKTYSVHYRGGGDAIVPGILMVPVGVKTAPCVLLLHGLGGRKEDVALLGVALARRGYASFAIDAAGHGERPKIDGKPVSDLTLPEFRLMAGQTVVDLRRAVDFLQTRADIDGKRVGFLGVSLGGILGAVFAADEPRIKGAALWAAGGDWGKLIIRSQHQFAQRFRQKGVVTEAEVDAVMKDVDPVNCVGPNSSAPLLFINGDKDTTVPTVCTDALYAVEKAPKKRIVLPGGHIPDLLAMMNATLIWLDANVKATAL